MTRSVENPDAGLALPLQQTGRTHVLAGRRTRKLIYFGGCDYFRLASHPAVLSAIHKGLDQHGLNVSASRRTTGNHPVYATLERALARFFDTDTATVVSNGYLSNPCAAQALAGEFTHALIDARAHGSLKDAALMLGCPVIPFRHADPADAARVATRCGRRARIVLLTDGLFSHSGMTAPLDVYLARLPKTARFMIDDAHAAGFLGRHGRGTLEHLGMGATRDPERWIQTVTLSKVFGVYGGAILGSRTLRRRIIEHSRIFVGNTPLPLPLVHGVLAAIEIIRTTPKLRRRLIFNIAWVKAALREAGWPVNDGPGPVVPIHPRSPQSARRLSRSLLRAGVHPPLIQYSDSPAPYLRIAISSEHDPEQLGALIQALGRPH